MSSNDDSFVRSSSSDVNDRALSNTHLDLLVAFIVFVFLVAPIILVCHSILRSVVAGPGGRSADDVGTKFAQRRYSRHLKRRGVAGTGIPNQHLDNILDIIGIIDKSLIIYNVDNK